MSSSTLGHVVVVGGGLAAARSCEQLRRRGHDGAITMVSAETHPPYDRPPLSKAVLIGNRDDTSLRVDLDDLGVRVHPGVRASGLGVADRVLATTEGDIAYDALVLATGAAPVRLPGDGEQLTLRTIDDALALRARLLPDAHVVLIGASWIGAEVATAALGAGCRVTCVESGPAPLATTLGEQVGGRLLDWWDGVEVRLGAAVASITEDGVELADGERIAADLVVTGVGVRPETGWLQGSGLDCDRGVVVDEWLRAGPGVVAVGDVAAWWSRRWGRRMRVEHWDNATTGPAVAVAALLDPDLAGVEVYDPVPYFWSDQFGHKLQYFGMHSDTDTLMWRQGERGWTVLWVGPAGRLSAALVADNPKEAAQARKAIDAGLGVDIDRVADPEVVLSEACVEVAP